MSVNGPVPGTVMERSSVPDVEYSMSALSGVPMIGEEVHTVATEQVAATAAEGVRRAVDAAARAPIAASSQRRRGRGAWGLIEDT